MPENKTKETSASVDKFLSSVKDKNRREDCYKIIKLMKKITKQEPKMWGPSIIGFGSIHYKYASGREGDMCITGFSPRKKDISLYIMGCVSNFPDDLKKLGKHKAGKSCLYINKVEDIDLVILEKIIRGSIKYLKTLYK